MMSWMNVMSVMTYMFLMNRYDVKNGSDVLDECHFRDD
jgi:hypothetical protein